MGAQRHRTAAEQLSALSDGTLVPLEEYAFPNLRGVNKPHEANEAVHLDFGPGWRRGILSLQPPRAWNSFPVLVPQVDADGNERDGIRLPEITVPLATITGWNLRDPLIGAPTERVSFEGSYIRFAKTEEERKKTNDPRPSIAERYSGKQDYLRRYAQAVDQLVSIGWILSEDRDSQMARAEQEWEDAVH